MKSTLVAVAVFISFVVPVLGQSKPSIQGVWRILEVTTTGPNASTIKNPQPGLYIFTREHFSIARITSTEPRSAAPAVKVAGKPTDPEKAAIYNEWAPFVAQSGAYSVNGSTLTLRPIVAKSVAVMGNKQGSKFEFKLDGNTLSLTNTTTPTGDKAPNPTTLRLSRVE
jgi:hypothetical protein